MASAKTAAVTSHLKALLSMNPNVGYDGAASGLKKRFGDKLSKPLFYRERKRHESKSNGRKPARPRPAVTFDDLLAVKEFAETVGGTERAKAILSDLSLVQVE